MSMDLTTLRKLAEAATPGEWRVREQRTGYITAPDGPRSTVRVATVGGWLEAPECAATSGARWKADAAFITAANPEAVLALLDRIERTEAEVARLREEEEEAKATLSAWFDLAEKMESQGADVLNNSLETWLRHAGCGGMEKAHADIARTVLSEAARLYLWNALVPVLRGIAAKMSRVAATSPRMQEPPHDPR